MPVLDDVTDAAGLTIESKHPRFRFNRRPDGSLAPWCSWPIHATGKTDDENTFTYRHHMGRAHLTVLRGHGKPDDIVEEAHLAGRNPDPTVDDLVADFTRLVGLLVSPHPA